MADSLIMILLDDALIKLGILLFVNFKSGNAVYEEEHFGFDWPHANRISHVHSEKEK